MLLTQLISLLAAAPSGCSSTFFGLIPWYQYLPGGDFGSPTSKCDITTFNLLPGSGSSDIPYVLLAVIDDLLRMAGLVAIGFIIYGAIQYVASEGSPDKTARAQSTIINALIGLVIAVTAVVFVTFLADRLGG